jgi:hypothetical protein
MTISEFLKIQGRPFALVSHTLPEYIVNSLYIKASEFPPPKYVDRACKTIVVLGFVSPSIIKDYYTHNKRRLNTIIVTKRMRAYNGKLFKYRL